MYARPGTSRRSEVRRVFDGLISATPFGRWVLAMVPAASMALAAGAQAQTLACDLLKAEMAARIEASGVRGYALEAVPAGTPVPPDARVIGNCETGAYKLLYRRWGATRAASGAASAAGPASAAQADVMPAEPPRRAPGDAAERTLRPLPPASAPGLAPKPVSRSNEAAFAVPAPRHEPEPLPTGSPAEAGPASAVERSVVAPVPPPSTGTTFDVKAPLARQASEFTARNWPWIAALVLLLVVGWIWRARFSAYDKGGLPRGPRL